MRPPLAGISPASRFGANQSRPSQSVIAVRACSSIQREGHRPLGLVFYLTVGKIAPGIGDHGRGANGAFGGVDIGAEFDPGPPNWAGGAPTGLDVLGGQLDCRSPGESRVRGSRRRTRGWSSTGLGSGAAMVADQPRIARIEPQVRAPHWFAQGKAVFLGSRRMVGRRWVRYRGAFCGPGGRGFRLVSLFIALALSADQNPRIVAKKDGIHVSMSWRQKQEINRVDRCPWHLRKIAVAGPRRRPGGCRRGRWTWRADDLWRFGQWLWRFCRRRWRGRHGRAR